MALPASRQTVSPDPTAWLALFDRCVETVYGYVYARVRRRAEAELLTEQVFVRAWHTLRSGGWSGRGVPRRLCEEADALLAHVQGRRRASDPVDELSPDQRHVLLLRFGLRLDVAGVAELLGMDEPSVQRLQLRALQALSGGDA